MKSSIVKPTTFQTIISTTANRASERVLNHSTGAWVIPRDWSVLSNKPTPGLRNHTHR